MTMLSPRGHTPDSRELLTAVTARMPLQLVIDNTPRRVTECDLVMRAAERDAYRFLAEIGRPFGFLDARAEQRAAEPLPEPDRCQWCPGTAECIHPRCLEMACAAPSAPSVPTRRNRRLPRLSFWRRLWLALFPTWSR